MSSAFQSLVTHGWKLLARRPHSKNEITFKLSRLCIKRKRSKRKHIREEVASEAVTYLEELNLIDDEAYCQWHINQRAEFKPRSKLQLKAEFFAKGVDPKLVEKYLMKYDERRACLRIADSHSRLSDDDLLKFLCNKGFPLYLAEKTIVALRKTAAIVANE